MPVGLTVLYSPCRSSPEFRVLCQVPVKWRQVPPSPPSPELSSWVFDWAELNHVVLEVPRECLHLEEANSSWGYTEFRERRMWC